MGESYGKRGSHSKRLQPLEAECSDVDRAWLPEHRYCTQHISSKKPEHTSSIPPLSKAQVGEGVSKCQSMGSVIITCDQVITAVVTCTNLDSIRQANISNISTWRGKGLTSAPPTLPGELLMANGCWGEGGCHFPLSCSCCWQVAQAPSDSLPHMLLRVIRLKSWSSPSFPSITSTYTLTNLNMGGRHVRKKGF